MPLLLTQPMSRSRLWSHKMLLVTVTVFAAALAVFGLAAGVSGWYPDSNLWENIRTTFRSEEMFMAGVFLFASVCSCAYWTLLTGSVIGGLVFTVAAQFIAGVGIGLLWGQLRGYDEPFEDSLTFLVIAVSGMVYSGLFLWLGWRRFTRLEVRTGHFGEGGLPVIASSRGSVWSRLLACRPKGCLLNFVRKELRLQKAVVRFGVVFVLCWLAVVLLQWLRPGQHFGFLLDVLTFVYAPVASLLAGCISLGEEKAFGVTISQRALPFAPWLQWLLKLTVSGATAAVCGLALPLLLLLATNGLGEFHDGGLVNNIGEAILTLAFSSAVMFVLGYWAIGLATNTLRAALLAIAGFILLFAFAILGMYLGSLLLAGFGGQVTGAGRADNQIGLILRDTAICAILVMLGQSLLRFRLAEECRTSFLYPFIVGAVVVGFSFWATCYG